MLKTALKIWLIFSISLNNISMATDPVLIHKGEIAPIEGLLFSPEKAQDIKYKLLENDSLSKSIELYKANEIVYNTQISQLQTQNDKLGASLKEDQTSSFMRNFLMFSLGVAATSFAVFGVKKISQ